MNIPDLGNLVPQTVNVFRKTIGRLILYFYRWDIEGNINNSPKLIVSLAPHTSNWDFITNMGTMLSMGILSKWFVAKEFYWWPLKVLLKWLGGIPVDRSKRQNLVDEMVELIGNSKKIILSIYPEGATKKKFEWKTGIWYIAKNSKVPIQLVGLDYENRKTIFGPVIELTDSVQKDMKKIQMYYKNFHAKYPDNFGSEYYS